MNDGCHLVIISWSCKSITSWQQIYLCIIQDGINMLRYEYTMHVIGIFISCIWLKTVSLSEKVFIVSKEISCISYIKKLSFVDGFIWRRYSWNGNEIPTHVQFSREKMVRWRVKIHKHKTHFDAINGQKKKIEFLFLP